MKTDNILYWMRMSSDALAKHGDSGTSLELWSAYDAVITLISQRDALVEAAKNMVKLYGHIWDKSDGNGVVIFGDSVERFDDAFDQLRKALGETL